MARDDDAWASIRIELIGGSDVKTATRLFDPIERCIVLMTARVPAVSPTAVMWKKDVFVLEVGSCGPTGDWGFLVHPVDSDGLLIVGATPEFVRFEDVRSVGVY